MQPGACLALPLSHLYSLPSQSVIVRSSDNVSRSIYHLLNVGCGMNVEAIVSVVVSTFEGGWFTSSHRIIILYNKILL